MSRRYFDTKKEALHNLNDGDRVYYDPYKKKYYLVKVNYSKKRIGRAKTMNIIKAISVGILQVFVWLLIFYGVLTLEIALLYALDFSYLADYNNISIILSISGLFLLSLGFPIYLAIKVAKFVKNIIYS